MNTSNWWAHPGMRLAFLRQLHSYLGAFIAPSVLFFALTGALQIFSLHEAHGNYTPPPLIEKLAKVHKDQVFEAAHKHAKPKPGPEAAAAPPPAAHEDADRDADPDQAPDHVQAPKPDAPDADHDHEAKHGPKLGTVLLKWMFLVVALGLATSTCLGVWMGIAHSRQKASIWALLVLGTIVPIVLLLI